MASFNLTAWQSTLTAATEEGWRIDFNTGALLDDDDDYSFDSQERREEYRETIRDLLRHVNVAGNPRGPPLSMATESDDDDHDNAYHDNDDNDDHDNNDHDNDDHANDNHDNDNHDNDNHAGANGENAVAVVTRGVASGRFEPELSFDGTPQTVAEYELSSFVYVDVVADEVFTADWVAKAIQRAKERWCPSPGDAQYGHPIVVACRRFRLGWDGITTPPTIDKTTLMTNYRAEISAVYEMISRACQAGLYTDLFRMDSIRVLCSVHYSFQMLMGLYNVASAWKNGFDSPYDPCVAAFKPLDYSKADITDYQHLVIYLLNKIFECRLRRQNNEWLCERVYNDTNVFVHTYRPVMTIGDFVSKQISMHDRFELWQAYCKDGSTRTNLIRYLSQCQEPQMPDLKKDRYVHSFRNGLYFVLSDTFVRWDERPIPKETVACKYHPLDFDTHESLKSVDFLGDEDGKGPRMPNTAYDIPTPTMEKIMRDQGWDYPTRLWNYVMLGRMLYWARDKERWQVWPFYFGLANTGKCLDVADEVLLYDGRRVAAGDVRIGDVLLGENGSPRIVYETTSGVECLYAISDSQRRRFSCTANHRLVLHTSRDEQWVVTLKRLLAMPELYTVGDDGALSFDSTIVTGYQRAVSEFPLPTTLTTTNHTETDVAWFIGLWIGSSGSRCAYNCLRSSKLFPREVTEKLYTLAQSWGCTVTITRRDTTGNSELYYYTLHEPFIFDDDFRRLGLGFETPAKIPSAVMSSSRACRLSVLAGLIDSNGYYDSGKNCYTIESQRKDLADDTATLARTLGFNATVHEELLDVPGRISFVLHVELCGDGLHEVPCVVARNRASLRDVRDNTLRTSQQFSFTVRPLGARPYAGFELRELPTDVSLKDYLQAGSSFDMSSLVTTSESGKFLLGDCTVTHNSTMCQVYEKYFYDSVDVSSISNTFEKTFGLWSICDSFGVFSSEVGDDFAMDRTELQQIISAETVTIRAKNMKALPSFDWRSHGMLAGNHIPAWNDPQGAMARRLFIFMFSKRVTVDGSLLSRLGGEVGNLILKCNRIYRAAVEWVGDRSVWDVAPESFHENRRRLQAEISPLHGFLLSGEVEMRFTPDGLPDESIYVPVSVLKERFRVWQKENNMQGGGRWNQELYSKALRDNKLNEPVKSRKPYPRDTTTRAQQLIVYGIDLADEVRRLDDE